MRGNSSLNKSAMVRFTYLCRGDCLFEWIYKFKFNLDILRTFSSRWTRSTDVGWRANYNNISNIIGTQHIKPTQTERGEWREGKIEFQREKIEKRIFLSLRALFLRRFVFANVHPLTHCSLFGAWQRTTDHDWCRISHGKPFATITLFR